MGRANPTVLRSGAVYTPNANVKSRGGEATLGQLIQMKAGLFALEGERRGERRYEHVPGVRIQNLLNGVWNFFKMALYKQALRGAALDMPDLEYAVAMKSEHSPYEVALAVALIERMQRFCCDRGMRLIVLDSPARPRSTASPSPSPRDCWRTRTMSAAARSSAKWPAHPAAMTAH